MEAEATGMKYEKPAPAMSGEAERGLSLHPAHEAEKSQLHSQVAEAHMRMAETEAATRERKGRARSGSAPGLRRPARRSNLQR